LSALFPLPVAVDTPDTGAIVCARVVQVSVQSEWDRAAVGRDCCRNSSTCYNTQKKRRKESIQYVQWRTGPPENREISRWAPASRNFSGPRPYTRIYFIDNQLTQSADRLSTQRTGHDVRRVSPSERTTVMYLIHSPAGCRLPESKLFLMRTKKPYCRFHDHNWHFINESRLYVKPLCHRVVESSFPFLTMRKC